MMFAEGSSISSELIELYILYLLKQKKYKTNTINQIISSIIFYCKHILDNYALVEPIERLKKEMKLPGVLSQYEVRNLLNAINNLKHRAIFYVLYSAGLRLSEVVKLKAVDIDTHRELIFVRGGKGKKDRYSLLSIMALNALRQICEEL